MDDIVKKIIAGDVRTVARLIRDIDDGIPEVREVLKKLYPYTGNAYVIGITGAPGVGKSTLVDQMVAHLRDQGKTVGVLAVDPTSPFAWIAGCSFALWRREVILVASPSQPVVLLMYWTPWAKTTS